MIYPARRLAELSPKKRRKVLEGLTPAELAALEYEWSIWARPDQLPPPPPWRTRLLLGGRGSGKTCSSAEWIRAEMTSGRRRQMGIIAPTADSLRGICVEGPSGLMSVGPPDERPQYEPSTRRVVYPNGGIVRLFSAEEPDRLRGPNLDGNWLDELTSMDNANAVWDMLQMALRIPGPQGHPPCGVISTTPKMHVVLRQIMKAPTTDPSANGPSPDRVDALVWCLTDLMGGRSPITISKEALEASARPRGSYPSEPGFHGVKIF